MTRRAITEADVRAAGAGSTLPLPQGAVITPAARDLARKLGVVLSQAAVSATPRAANSEQPPAPSGPIVALGADHGGFPLKEELKTLLGELGYTVHDVGTHSKEAVDYPDFAVKVARAVAEGRAWRGIMVDGAGIGSAMAANKIRGVRAALCYDLTTALNAREHNDANVLTLGGTLIGTRIAGDIVKAFLTTDFGGGRHAGRVAKINSLDR